MQLYVELTIFLLLPVSNLNAMYRIKLCQEQLWRDLASVNLKFGKLNYSLRVLLKVFCISVFNVKSCLASSLTLDHSQQLDP